MNIILKKMVVKCSEDIEELFNKIINKFPKIRDKILLDGRKIERSNKRWRDEQKWNVKQKVAQEQKV